MKIGLRVYAAAACSIFFWSSAFVAIRMGLESYSPGPLALLRFAVASLCMWFLVLMRPSVSVIPWQIRFKLMLIGVLGIAIYHLALNYGEVSVTAGVASFVIGLMPVFTVALSMLFLGERPGPYAWIGIAISLLGLVSIMMAEGDALSMSRGVFFILISALAGAIQTVTQKRYLHDYHPIEVSAWVIWGGTLVLMMFSQDLLQEIKVASSYATWSGIYLGIFPAAVAYMTWGFVLRHMPASKATVYFYAMPVFSTTLAYLFLNEQPAFLSLMGGAMALVGAMLASKKRKIAVLDESNTSPSCA